MSCLKSVLTLTFFTFLSFTLYGQVQTADINEGCELLEVRFQAPSGSTFFWDFGDGSSSTQRNPAHTYDADMTEYTVVFRNTEGGPVINTETINVYPQPEIDFGANPMSGCVPLTTMFTDASQINPDILGSITDFNWTFGDGTSGSGNPISHNYDMIGSYTVSLEIVSNLPNCTVSNRIEDFITTSMLDASFTVDNISACVAPLTVNFTNTTDDPNNDLVYSWDFGNGNVSTDRNPPAQNYTQEGAFPITLTVTDTEGCSSTATDIVNIGSPLVGFNILDTLCSGEPILLDNTSSNGSYLWNFGAGADPMTSTARNPTVTFFNQQNYNISLTVTDPGGCSNDTTITVYVDMIFADFVSDPVFSCDLPQDFTYTPTATNIDSAIWTFNDMSQSMDMIGTFTVPGDTSTYGINGEQIINTTLTVFNERGCKGFFERSDTVHAANALFTLDTTMGCAPLTVMFFDSLSTANEDIVSYTFVYGDGGQETFTNTDPVSYTYNTPGDYEPFLIIENASGCLDTSFSIPVFVGEGVMADFTASPTTICPGDSIVFMGTGDATIDAWHFDVEGGRLSHCADDANPTWFFESMTGTMDVELTVLYNGCPTTVSKSDFITVNGPLAQIDYLIECDAPFDVEFEDLSMDANDRKWFFGNGDSSLLSNPTITYAEEGDFEVILESTNAASGCPTSFDTVTVSIRDIKAEFELDSTYCQGVPIMFDATMSNGVNADCWKGYTWNPSDTNPPIVTQDSIIEYAWMGIDTQTVELFVEDINGCRDTLRDTTFIVQTISNFTFAPNPICTPNDVTFTDGSTSNATIESWSWMFGDGDSSMLQNPVHTYGNPGDFSLPAGTFQVTLTTTDEFECTGMVTQSVDIYAPAVILNIPDANLCVGETLEFSATDVTNQGSFLTYEWFLDGVSLGITADNGSRVMPDAGVFELRVEFTEDATGCRQFRTRTISVQNFPDATFTSPLDANAVNCAGPITFTANDANNPDLDNNSYTWNAGTNMGPISTVGSFSTFYDRGTFTPSLILSTTNGCIDTFSREYVFVAPAGTLTASDRVICLGESIDFIVSDLVDVESFRLDLGDGTVISNDDNVTHTFLTTGSFAVRLILEQDLAGEPCTADELINITVDDVDATFSADTLACPGEPVIFTIQDPSINTSDFEIIWDFGNGDMSNELNPVYSDYLQEGNFTITLIVRSRVTGCSDTFFQDIEINSDGDLGLSITGDLTICRGVETSTLSVTSSDGDINNYSVTWNGAGILPPNTGSTITITPDFGAYTVDVIRPDGCRDSEMINVSLLPDIPVPDSTLRTVANNDDDFRIDTLYSVLNNSDRFTIVWNPVTSLAFDNNNTEATLQRGWQGDSLVYTATVFDLEGCYTDTVFQRIVRLVEIPNIFSPNDDNRNDNFNFIGGFDVDDIVSFRVFNRWGQMIYDNDNPTTGWDGTFNDEDQPVGVYVYIIELDGGGENGEIETLSGDVTLIR